MRHFTYAAVVNIIFYRDNRILLSRRFNTGYHDGEYEMPSGHMEGNEAVQFAAAREASEEVGVSIKVEDLSVVHVMHRFGINYERIEFFLIAEAWTGLPSIREPHECGDISWFHLDELPVNMVPKSKKGIERVFSGTIFSEYVD